MKSSSINKFLGAKIVGKAYHEASHCVVAAVFLDILKFNILTINEIIAKEINPSYVGGLKISFNADSNEEEFVQGDHLILIALAGICGQTLFHKGHEYVKQNLLNFKSNDQLLDTTGAVDDYEITQSFSKKNAMLMNVQSQTIEWSAIRWNFEYLMIPEIWQATKGIAEAIIRKQNQTFDGNEIIEMIKKTGLKSYLDDNKKMLLAKRYPMTIGNFKT